MTNVEQINFFHGHGFFLWLEYGVYPCLLFYVIYRVVHKAGKSSEFYDVPPFLQIIARNWLELTLTFVATLVFFELRINMEHIPLLIEHDNLFTFSPFRLFALGNYIFIIIFYLLFYYISITKRNSDQVGADVNILGEDAIHAKVASDIKNSFLPISIFIQLWISTLCYTEIYLRSILTIASVVISIWVVLHYCYTPTYWRVLAIHKKTHLRNISMQFSALDSFFKAYNGYIFKSQAKIKFDSALECAEQIKYISDNFPILGENVEPYSAFYENTIDILESCYAYARQIKDPNQDQLAECLHELRQYKHPKSS